MYLWTHKEYLEEYRTMREAQGVRCDKDLCGVFSYCGAKQGIFDLPPLPEPERYKEYTRQEWIDENLAYLKRIRAIFAELHSKDIPLYMDFNTDRLKLYVIGNPHDMESTDGYFPMPFSGWTNMDCVKRFIADNPQKAIRFKRVNHINLLLFRLDELISKKESRCIKYLKRYSYKINLV